MITRNLLARHLPVILGLALVIGVVSDTSAAGTDRACQTAAAEHLQNLGVGSQDIKEINMVRIIGLPELGNTIELQGWAILKSCQGSVVMKLTPACRPKETYSRGNCDIPNVRNF